jgi:hypothetical protein
VAGILPLISTSSFDYQPNYASPNFRLSAEYKVSPALSVNLGYAYGKAVQDIYPNESYAYDYQIHHSNSVNLQTRWYFDMARRIREGKSSNNCSGNYLGLEYGYDKLNFTDIFNPRSESQHYSERQSIGVRFGMQRRIFRYGYFDISYGIGYQRTGLYNQKIAIGFSLAQPNAKSENSDYCDALHCFQEERHLLKFDLYNALILNSLNRISGKPSVSFEQKIGHSSFAVESSLAAIYDYAKGGDHERGAEISIEPKRYYTMKKRIARGKSGNNLNGMFYGLMFRGKYLGQNGSTYNDAPPFYYQYAESTKSLSILGEWGVQFHLFRHAFIQYKIGIGPMKKWQQIKSPQSNSVPYSYWDTDFNSELKLGLAF